MKIIGVIAEFNPFHNGHEFLLKKIKEENKDSILIIILSSYFTNRGELCVHSIHQRAKYALKYADIILSLPFVFSCQSADYFASAAIKFLSLLKITDLYFGSEENNEKIYLNKIELLNKSNDKIKEYLKLGYSYKKATQEILNLKSNDILGLCYLKAIKDQNLNISIHTIKRIGDAHNSVLNSHELYTSSSVLRKNADLVKKYAPKFTSNKFLNYKKLYPYIKYNFINSNLQYENNPLFKKGIYNYIKNKINQYDSYDNLITELACQRYTKSNINRVLIHTLFNNNLKHSINEINFVRIIGFNTFGQNYLKTLKKHINIITSNKEQNDILKKELAIAKTLDLIYNKNFFYKEISKPIIIKKS